jgi:cytochrome P450/predicted MFS family arabinose efflux permease
MPDDASFPKAPTADAYAIPLEDIDVSRPELWSADAIWPYFERLRREDPVHYCRASQFGPYWSVTRFHDIMAVDTNHEVFSSHGNITIVDEDPAATMPMFIAMDPPRHDAQRKVVSPIVAPANLARMEALIRSRAAAILDALPIGETFDWVEGVSIELTTQMLATLFDFPFEDRRKLTWWSDVANVIPGPGELVESQEEQTAALMECLEYFVRLWNQRVNAEPALDLVSMLAHADATRNMTPMEYLGNVILLIVGGNDTTRNTIAGSVLALNQNPAEYQKLRENPALIPSMVSETVRWQTPLAHMRRTATRDTELAGKRIAKGDKVIMWYVSGNRDEAAIDSPDRYIIDRERPRQHLSFGFGIHRCVGNRLAEMQLRIVWEEILERFPVIEVVGEPVRLANPFTKGYASLPVRIPPSAALPARRAAESDPRPTPSDLRPTLHRQPLAVFAGACAVSAGGALLFNVMPALLAAAAARFALDDGALGALGSSFLAGAALSTATANLWIDRFDWRAITLAAAAAAVAGLAACAAVPSFPALLAALLAAGVGLGALYTVGIAVISEHHRPDSAFGVKLAGEVFLAVATLAALTSFVGARWGFPGTALTLAGAVGLAAFAGLPVLPARRALIPPEKRFAMTRRAGPDGPRLREWMAREGAPWLGLLALFVSFAGLSALWGFLARIAHSFGVGDQATAAALTAGLVVSGVAGFAAAAIGDRFGRVKPLAAGMLLATIGVAVLLWGHGFAGYLTGLVLTGGLWNFPLAYQMGLIASSDGNGRVAVLMPAALAIGGAVGPMLAGALLAGGQGYAPLYALFAGATTVALATFALLGRWAARRAR